MRDDLKKDHIAVNWTCSNPSHDFQAIFWHCNLRRSSDSHSYIYWDNTLQTVVWTLGSMFNATFYLCQRPEALCSRSLCLLFAVVILVCRGKKSKCWHECFRNMWIKSIVKIYFELNILEFHCHQLDCHIRTEGDWWIHAWWFKLLSSQLKKKEKGTICEFHLQLLLISQRGRCLRTEGVPSGSCCPLLAGNISYTDDEIISNANGKTVAHQLRVSEWGQKAAGCHTHTD